MEIVIYNNENIGESAIEFYDKLSMDRKYDYNKTSTGIPINNIGRYKMSKQNILSINPNIDINELLYTKEGHKIQDNIVMKYHANNIWKYIKKWAKELSGKEFYVDDKRKYINDKHEINWEDISKIFKNNPKYIYNEDARGRSIRLSYSGLIAASHYFTPNKVFKFLNENTDIYCDENKLPITFYIEYFSSYSLDKIIGEIEEDKLVISIDGNKDKIFGNNKFIGEKKGEDIWKSLEELLKNKEIIKLLKEKINPQNKNEEKELAKKILNESKINKENNKDNENKNELVWTENNEKTQKTIKDKIENGKYKNDYAKYFEESTNRIIDEVSKNIVGKLLEEFEKITKDNNGIGNLIKQKGFNELRGIVKANTPMNTEDILSYIYNNSENKINNLEKILKKSNINPEKDLMKSNGKYDDKKAKEILSNIKENKNKIYEKDEKGEYKYKKVWEVITFIYIEYIKWLVGYKDGDFDGNKDRINNIVNKYLIWLDEMAVKLKISKPYNFLMNIGSKLNITNIVVNLLKSKLAYRDEALDEISRIMMDTYNKYTTNKNRAEDEKSIKDIFPNKKSMKNYMSLKGWNNIYEFYKEFYDINKEETSTSKIFVCSGATVGCTMSAGDISKLIVKEKSSKINGNNRASISDTEIIPFKYCASKNICKPEIIGKWTKESDVKVDGEYALLNTSKIYCAMGGNIKIITPGQTDMKIFIPKKEENKDINIKEICPYTDINDLIYYLIYELCNKYNISQYKLLGNIEIIGKIKLKEDIKKEEYVLRNKYYPKIDYGNYYQKYTSVFCDKEKANIFEGNEILKIITGYLLHNITGNIPTNRLEKIGYKLYQDTNGKLSPQILLESIRTNCNIIKCKYENKKSDRKNRAIWMKIAYEEYDNYYNSTENSKKLAIDGSISLSQKIKEYHLIGGGLNGGGNIPWCTSFINWIINKTFGSNIKFAASQEFINNKNYKKIDEALYGSIAVFATYNDKNNKTGKGHTTFIIGISNDKQSYICLGGNQNNRIKLSSYSKNKRIKLKNGYMKLIGIYWPKDYPISDIDRLTEDDIKYIKRGEENVL